MEKRLYRSRTNRIIWGVCGGLAEYFNLDPAIIRVIFVILTFMGGLGVIAYIVLAIVTPMEGAPSKAPRDVVKENVQEMADTATQLSRDVQSSQPRKDGAPSAAETHRASYWLGAVIIIIGLFFLLRNVLPFPWLNWGVIWPAVIRSWCPSGRERSSRCQA